MTTHNGMTAFVTGIRLIWAQTIITVMTNQSGGCHLFLARTPTMSQAGRIVRYNEQKPEISRIG